MAKEPIAINSTTFEVELSGGDKVEIGDKEAVDFKPHLKFNRWGGECFIKMGLPTTEKVTPIVEAGKVKWIGNKVDAHLYPLEPTTMNELGGFEFEIVLKEKPATNEIVFDFEAQGLRFSYQPPLTQQEIDAGNVSPDNVVGSYAVYHIAKKNNQYGTGKAFHLYRPQAEDAYGKKVWCGLSIDRYIDPTSMVITVPQTFLDEATYPVTIDPDLGDTGIGGLSCDIASSFVSIRRGTAWTMPAPGGTVNYIRAYIAGDDLADCKTVINQKDSGGGGTHGQIAGPVENLECGFAWHWEEFTFSGEILVQGIDYIPSILANDGDLSAIDKYYLKYDVNGGVASYYEGNTYAAPESPWVVNPEGTTLDYSIYANYTEAAPPIGLENKSANMGSKMVAAGLI